LITRYRLTSIGIFGSFTREDFHEDSDIDILIDYDSPIGIEFIDLADELEKILKRKVDLVSKNGVKPKYYEEIQKDLIYV
jgi:predicted nucleotidyltransferase